jgi:DNA processing protein
MKTPERLPHWKPIDLRCIAPGHREWPERLGELGPLPPPKKLSVAGRPIDVSARAVAVVGSRRPTAAGIEAAEQIARGLAESNFVVVSGLAIGIDAVAHRAALDAGGHTIAVIGGGMDLNYPERNERLRYEIDARGTVVSEYAQGDPPRPYHFPQRNRIIVGLCEAVVVVEGSIRSGALISARIGLDANRQIFAVPGSIRNPYASGPNQLIRLSQAGAVTCVDDIFEEIAPDLVYKGAASVPMGAPPKLDEAELAVLDVLDDAPVTCDLVAKQLAQPRGKAALALSKLEIRGMARRQRGAYLLTRTGASARAAHVERARRA